MDTRIRTILTDLKAAARIGHPESIQAALDGLRALPQVASNQPLSDEFISKTITPIGLILSKPRLPIDLLKPLTKDPLVALRALAAAAFALRYLDGGQVTLADVASFVNDPRAEVRMALVQALLSQAQQHPDKLAALVNEWLAADMPHLQQIGLQLVAGLPAEQSAQVIPQLSSLGALSDPDSNADLVAALNSLAQKGFSADILSLLSEWLRTHTGSAWVITRTLSSSWAAGAAQAALRLLRQLALQNGAHKQIISALRALTRHGAGEAIQNELARWEKNEDENLRAIADKVNK